jgi:hypothetical protein
MHRLINSFPGFMHQSGAAFHNLKKFFSFGRRKYTLAVHKDLSAKILLSKKENIVWLTENSSGLRPEE